MEQHPQSHAFLIRRHGLYTWGETLTDAERHVEILEFLFETIGRTASFSASREEVYHGVVENS
jgi:ribulose-5-phosphate 4-epimerase/fuculose-1-phosphate aldolase